MCHMLCFHSFLCLAEKGSDSCATQAHNSGFSTICLLTSLLWVTFATSLLTAGFCVPGPAEDTLLSWQKRWGHRRENVYVAL